jgi:membrane-associated phospholipid phosphatase
MSGSVGMLKSSTHILRPDGSTYNSFPSGHTSTAFMGAQFMWEEYKDVSPWYGIAGYAVATTTGVLRLYNNRHWVSDVVTGAGIGMLSTKAAYWLYPKLQRAFIPKSAMMNAVILPTYNAEWKTAGISLLFMPH